MAARLYRLLALLLALPESFLIAAAGMLTIMAVARLLGG
jgi:hypothetical protein